MTRSGGGEILSLVCVPMEESGFANAFSTRHGGLSPLPERALHLSFRGDETARVEENRERFLRANGWDNRPLVTVHQTHSDVRAWVEKPDPLADGRDARHPEPNADAVLSRHSHALLAVKVADCVPILIADPASGTAAAIHAGWRGTLSRIVEKSIADLAKAAGTAPRRLIAALGPSACGRCYVVQEDVAAPFRDAFHDAEDYLRPDGTAFSLDVAAANLSQLRRAGLSEERTFRAPFCTMHQNELFFSHRKEGAGGPTGRLLGVIGRREAS